jgi:hypothetical protein
VFVHEKNILATPDFSAQLVTHCTATQAQISSAFGAEGSAKYSISCIERGGFAFVFAIWSVGSSNQAEGLTDEQRIELGQLAELSDRKAFWDLFNESVSPLTGYRIESHTLQLQPNLFKAETVLNLNAQRNLRAFASSPSSTKTLQPGDISPPGNDLN